MYGNFKYGKDRFGFAAPFLLGALTGGVAVGAFNPYRPRPVYYQIHINMVIIHIIDIYNSS